MTDTERIRNNGLLHRDSVYQLLKYAVVGVMNTILTLVVIFVCKSLLNVNPYVSNAIGYVAGLINSFMWNRTWVFHAKTGRIHRQALYFLGGFALCYLIQLLVVWSLNQSSFGDIEILILGFTLSGYGLATLIGNVVYTLCNFMYNKVIAFKTK